MLLRPDAPEMNRHAPELFRVRVDTSKGPVVIEVHRDWAPRGADRFYNLVRNGYYDESSFFRIKAGYWVQFGINGDSKISNAWRDETFPDDPRRESNVRGTIAFAFAVPNGRTTQVFVNLRDNSATHDGEPFVPFGRVIEGMEVMDALNSEYGETAGGGIRGGKQGPLFEQGNGYLRKNFPRLDWIRSARIVEAGQSRAPVPAGILPAVELRRPARRTRCGQLNAFEYVTVKSGRQDARPLRQARRLTLQARTPDATDIFPLATSGDLEPILTLQPLLNNETKQLL
jgi:peptidyl-prolyl cis-trans isomerase A (cyclophilin A)